MLLQTKTDKHDQYYKVGIGVYTMLLNIKQIATHG